MNHSSFPRRGTLATFIPCALAALLGCGGDGSGDAPYAQIKGAPGTAGALEGEAVAMAAPVERLGGTSAGTVVAVAGGRVFEIVGKKVETRTLYAVGNDPLALGKVHAIAPRLAGGAWLGADEGLFVLEGLYVSRAPLLDGKGAIRGIAEIPAGPLAGLWLACDGGLYRRSGAGGDLERYSFTPLTGPVRGIVVDSLGTAAFVVIDDDLLMLRLTGGKLQSERPPFDAAPAHVQALAAGSELLVASTEAGIVRWAKDRTPEWARFTLAPPGAAAVVPRGVVVDRLSPVIWALTDTALVRLEGEGGETHDLPASKMASSAAMGIDLFGDVWIDRGTDVLRLATGPLSMPGGVTFDGQLKPWLGANCSRCHADFVDPEVFAPKAEAAFHRVRSGDMPRCEGGVPCPADKRLVPSELDVLEGWIRGGKPR